MTGSRTQARVTQVLAAGVLVLASSAANGGAAARQAGDAAPARPAFEKVAWTELSYSAHKFFLGASTTVGAEMGPAAPVAALLRTPPAGAPIPLPASNVLTITSKTKLPFDRDEAVTVWLDPATGAALGGEKTMKGGSAYHKFLRFTEGGLFTWRREPANERESKLPVDAWSGRSQYLVAPAARPSPGTPVTDSYALIYLVSAARLDRRGGALTLVMLADDTYVEMTFASGGLTYVPARFDETWPGGGRRREGNVLVRTVRATARALGDRDREKEDVELGFLGMRGALTLYLEVGTGVPVALAGRVQYIGELTVRLGRAVLAAPPSPDASAKP